MTAFLRALSSPRTARRLPALMVLLATAALWLNSTTLHTQPAATQAAAQVLTFTGNDSITAYASAPTTATAGPATIVFENSAATGNTTGMPHTLTFDTSTPGYNHDVDLNITASPYDPNKGRYEAQVNLTPGKYRYFCAMAGHQMSGEFVVTGSAADTTPPQVSASVTGDKDAAGNYVGSATVTISAQDTESGVDTVEYSLDGQPFTAYSSPVTVNQPGQHMVHYRAKDKAGNTSPEGMVSFTVVAPPAQDKTPPQVSAQVSGTKDGAGNYVNSATVTISASDAESGVATVEYSLDGQPYAAYTAPVAVNQPGKHTVNYRATDKAGNTSNVGAVEFTVTSPPGDTTAPQVSAAVAGDKDASGNYVGSATVTISAQDSESGVATVEYALDQATFVGYSAPVSVNQPGQHTVRYRATDKAGNVSAVGSVQFTVVTPPAPGDTTAPQVSAVIAGSMDWAWNYVDSATVTISATDAGSGVATIEYSVDGQAFAAYTAPLTINQPGRHTVTYRATDKAGNTSAVGTASFSVVKSKSKTKPADRCEKEHNDHKDHDKKRNCDD
nr:chitobiase/beta-hexosaminidase C-terminal domain-containing protein [Planosporangium flavigriseum]